MPWLLRPPFLGMGRKSDFSGFFLRSVMSEKSLTEPCRRPGVVGLYWRIPILHLRFPLSLVSLVSLLSLEKTQGTLRTLRSAALEELNHRTVRKQRDDGLLPIGHPPHLKSIAPLLSQAILCPHLGDADAKQFLNRRLDFRLGRPGIDLERISRSPVFALLALVLRLVRALFGNQRTENDLVRFQLRPACSLRGVGHVRSPLFRFRFLGRRGFLP